ncbi:DUF3135 domain-containing protein [Aeromonas sp. FDAARGOS 1411]|uniref:DUF3135 domain-containing protein n=1 Tax=Aeromonas TaxID=642 RepID=UPI001C24CEBC|nr:DUF3135 domain-containing protein [Aeromonas sp. FDAARGOS 1411]QWZ95126.1 DUF3135 domain-containing protein [Aeromonas sp. FDAARGOS 1411]
MSLPDFDSLKAMAERNEGELEALLKSEIDIILQGLPPEQRRRLLGLQFQINCQKELSHNPMDCCIRLSNMLYLYYRRFRWALEEFKEAGTVPSSLDTNQKKGSVVQLHSSLEHDIKK